MTVELRGNSGSCLTAGILLLTRARSFGHRLDVCIIGNEKDITPVHGPALLHSPVLATCGIGRRTEGGAGVIVPGPATQPLAVCLEDSGCGEWFTIDRSGRAGHPGAQGFMRLFGSERNGARDAGRRLKEVMAHMGCSPEPALLDLLFSAPVTPMVRLSLLLRAGRAMSGETGRLTDHIDSSSVPDEPLPIGTGLSDLIQAMEDGRIERYLSLLNPRSRSLTGEWLRQTLVLSQDDPNIAALVCGLVEIGTQFVGSPAPGLLAPLDAAKDAVAAGFAEALGATGPDGDANAALARTYRFLGGRFGSTGSYPVELPGGPAPEDRVERWRWFCEGTQSAASTADQLWRRVIDPPQ